MPDEIIAHIDGGSRGNPGPAAIGATLNLESRPGQGVQVLFSMIEMGTGYWPKVFS